MIAGTLSGAAYADGKGREDRLIAMCLNAHAGRIDAESETFIAYDVTGTGPGVRSGGAVTDVHTALRARAPGHSEASTTTVIAHSLRADGFDVGEDGTGRSTPLVAVDARNGTQGDVAMTLQSSGTDRGFSLNCLPLAAVDGPKLDRVCRDRHDLDRRRFGHPVDSVSQVRRLTPTECERLQGFPDGWTGIPYRGKPAADGPRYRALGNAFAVPVVRWIARRIVAADVGELAEVAD